MNSAAAELSDSPEPERAAPSPALWLLAPFTYPLAMGLFAAQATIWMIARWLSQPAYVWLFLAGIVHVFHGDYWRLPLYALESFLLVQVGTFVFDTMHFTLHRLAESRSPLLRAVGALHTTHHRFLDEELRIHDQLRRANNTHHVLPEFATHVAVSLVAWPLLGPIPVARTILLDLFTLVSYFRAGGNDPNHAAHEVVRAARPSLFVDTWYHSLHHVHPAGYYSSINTAFDRLFGFGCHVRGRRVALAGATGVFGERLGERLTAAGAIVRALGDGEGALGAVDILVLGELAGAARVELIERFRRAAAGRRFPVEVWGLGEDRELLRAGRFSAHARRLYFDPQLYYRHVVLPARAGARSANAAWFFIRRGFRYVPADASGLGLLNFFKFRFLQRAAPLPSTEPRA